MTANSSNRPVDSLSIAVLVLLESLTRAAAGADAKVFAAAQEGDLGVREAVLTHDVVLTGDGGGKVPALARSLQGRSRAARALLNWVKLGTRIPGATMRPVEINGGPGALLRDGDGRLIAVWALEIQHGQIQSVSSIVNPEKLAHLGPVSDLAVLLRLAARN